MPPSTSFFCIKGVIVPPSKLVVFVSFPPMLFFLLGGINYEGGRSNHKSSFMKGVIVPPSKLIVNKTNPPKVCFLIRGGLLLRGGDYTYICVYIYIYIYTFT